MKKLTRRDFVKTSALAMASLKLASTAKPGAVENEEPAPQTPRDGVPRLRWLGDNRPALHAGSAWGTPWPKGTHPAGASFRLKSSNRKDIPIQSWPMAYWPDGSLKWTGHAIAGDSVDIDGARIESGDSIAPGLSVVVKEYRDHFEVDTGVIVCQIPRSGNNVIDSIVRSGRTIAGKGRLKALCCNSPDMVAGKSLFHKPYEGRLDSVTLEQSGPVRAVLKLSGWHHSEDGRRWLPFDLRLYFHAGGEAVRLVHTFVFDGDEQNDFISGLGIEFEVPLREESYNRHIRFAGENGGLWAEAVKGITGLRRDPGEKVRAAQLAGKPTPPLSEWWSRVTDRLHWIPEWGDFTLAQPSANAFTIRKRTKEGHAWIPAGQGKRSAGLGYVGDTSGGLAFGIRDFWQAHPSQLDIRDAQTDCARATLWFWSPESPPMDLRFYHDGLGQETYPQQLDAMDITYEDYEPGFGTPHGVARTSEAMLWAEDSTPSRERLVDMAKVLAHPPQIVLRPVDYLDSGVFAGLWSLPDRSSKEKANIEKRLDWSVDYYHNQVDQHHWYGFWDYGDFMHTYDSDRHVWRYDIGGYAWANSELSPDLWIWYSFLRTGRDKDFRLADALTRHTRDVDIYHLGRFAGLGTRHNVQHWGCSAKQLRISTAVYRRYHHFITTDERTRDVLDEVADADQQLANLVPTRKLPNRPPMPTEARIGVGTDWGSVAANWLSAWERTGDPRYRNWLEDSMRTIAEAPMGFFEGEFGYDAINRKLIPSGNRPEGERLRVSHLSAVFGLFEICAELIELIDIPEFRKAWLDYCRLYLADEETQIEQLGLPLTGINLRVGHSRLTAYAAKLESNAALADLAWSEFKVIEWGPEPYLETRQIGSPHSLNPVDEATWVTTNDTAQWGLAAIQNLALISDKL